MISTVFKSCCLTALSFIFLNTAQAQEYYRWVDAKGTTHYTKTPPPKQAKARSKVSTYGWKNSTAPAPQATSSSAAPEAHEAAEAAARAAQHQEANKALDQARGE